MRVFLITVLMLLAVGTSFVLGVYVGGQTVADRSAQATGEGAGATAKGVADPASQTGADAVGGSGSVSDAATDKGQAGDAAGAATGGANASGPASTGNGSTASETSRDRADDRSAKSNASGANAEMGGGNATDLPARILGILEAFRGQAGRSAGGAVAGAGSNDDAGASGAPGGLKSMSRAYAVQTRAALTRRQGEAVARELRRVAEQVSVVEARAGRVFVRTEGFANRPSARAAVRELARTTSVPLDVVRVTGASRATSDEATARAGAGG